MRLAIDTSTGPEAWGLPLDWDTIVSFQTELAMRAELENQRISNAMRGR